MAFNTREIEALRARLRYATRRVYSGDVMHQAADAIESLLEQRKRVLALCDPWRDNLADETIFANKIRAALEEQI